MKSTRGFRKLSVDEVFALAIGDVVFARFGDDGADLDFDLDRQVVVLKTADAIQVASNPKALTAIEFYRESFDAQHEHHYGGWSGSLWVWVGDVIAKEDVIAAKEAALAADRVLSFSETPESEIPLSERKLNVTSINKRPKKSVKAYVPVSERCPVRVYDREFMGSFPCSNAVTRDGFCSRHHPENVAKREAKRAERRHAADARRALVSEVDRLRHQVADAAVLAFQHTGGLCGSQGKELRAKLREYIEALEKKKASEA